MALNFDITTEPPLPPAPPVALGPGLFVPANGICDPPPPPPPPIAITVIHFAHGCLYHVYEPLLFIISYVWVNEALDTNPINDAVPAVYGASNLAVILPVTFILPVT